MIAYKVLTDTELAELERMGSFRGSAADQREGFIHLSTAAQLEATIKKHYAKRNDAYILAVDLDKLNDIVRWEPASNGMLYPHIYGDLDQHAVVASTIIQMHPDGSVKLPTRA
jgi:uncharacterized protein (DUF952 family)